MFSNKLVEFNPTAMCKVNPLEPKTGSSSHEKKKHIMSGLIAMKFILQNYISVTVSQEMK